MISFFRSLFSHPIIQSIIIYTGFVVILLTWPIANIVLKNDSFRIIGGWSLTAYFVFIFIFAVLPVFLLTGIEYFLKRKNEKYSLFFQGFIFITGTAIFWFQLTEFHLTPLLKGAGLITTPLRYSGLYFIFFVGGLIFIIFVYKLRKYIPLFLKYLSFLMIFALGLLFLNTLQTKAIYFSVNKDLPPISQQPSLKKNIYLLVFDGIALVRLMEGEEINKELFPNFYRLSQEKQVKLQQAPHPRKLLLIAQASLPRLHNHCSGTINTLRS